MFKSQDALELRKRAMILDYLCPILLLAGFPSIIVPNS